MFSDDEVTDASRGAGILILRVSPLYLKIALPACCWEDDPRTELEIGRRRGPTAAIRLNHEARRPARRAPSGAVREPLAFPPVHARPHSVEWSVPVAA